MNNIQRYLPYIFAAVLALLYLPVMPSWLKDVFADENNQHCMVIPFISLYIIYQKLGTLKEKLAAAPASKGNVLLFIAGLALYVVGILGDIIFFKQASLIVVIAGSVLYLYGKNVFLEIVFPLFYLIFTIPIPEAAYQAFSSPMKLFASKTAAHLIRFAGIPVYREGVNIFFPYTSIEVVDACSGMRSLISLLAVSTIFAYFFQKKTFARIVLAGSAVPIAILSNVVRIVLTGIIAHSLGQKYAQGILHTVLGTVVVLAIGISLLLFVNYLINVTAKKFSHAAQ
jgi:exosortase